jgi:hypothetical protein
MEGDRIWFHRQRLQWWRVLRVSLLWGGLLAVLVLAFDTPERERPPAAVAVVPSAPASAFLSRRGFTGLANAPVAAERAARLQPSPTVARAGEVEVCGVGAVKGTPADPAGLTALEALRSPAAAAAWLDTVIASGDERARAAALYVRGQLARADATRGLAEPDPRCMDNPVCRKPFEELSAATAERGAARWRDALAQLAARTSDPAAYAYAVQACRAAQGGARAGPCQQVSIEHWARMDERNGVPWLLVADAARARNDAAGAAEAIQRAAQADHLRFHGHSLVQALLSSAPRELSPAQAALLTHDVAGMQVAWNYPTYQAATRHCSEGAQSTGVRDTCRQLAELMVRKPGTLQDLSIGIVLGERAGWPADRVKSLRDSFNSLHAAGSRALVSDMGLGCQAVDRYRRFFVEVARVGEVAAFRQAAAASAPR